MNIRIGHGFDVHAFGEGEFITLSGVRIPYEHGFIAHSDGDVALHAVTDAILGAAALGDIGQHFPDTDPQYRGANSRELLRHALQLVQQQGYRIGNVDVTIMAQAPKLAVYIPAMRTHLASDLNVELNCVNIKATTTEKLGFVGRKEGIAVAAVALIERQA